MTGHIQTTGTRAQVWHGTAKHTSGGLTKSNLMQNKSGRIVSRAKHNTAKREMRLVKYGYGTKKGEFGYVKVGSHKRSSRKGKSRKMRGGATAPTTAPSFMGSIKSMGSAASGAVTKAAGNFKGGAGMGNLSPAEINSDYMIKDVVPQNFGPLERALVGGKRRNRHHRSQRRSRSQRGGYYGNSFVPADAMGQGIDGQGMPPAGMAGGRGRGRGRGMMGGTGSRGYAPADLGSVDVQFRAGSGN